MSRLGSRPGSDGARAARRIGRGNRMLGGFAILAMIVVCAASRLHVNASWSDDAWGYLLVPIGTPRRGNVVIFEPPEALGASAPYLKTVQGVPGERVSVDDKGRVLIEGKPVGRAKPFALGGRALVPIAPVVIPPEHYYLHGDHADSHDSRYVEIGLVPRERILGRAVALPDLPWLGLDGPLVRPPGGLHSTGQPSRMQKASGQGSDVWMDSGGHACP